MITQMITQNQFNKLMETYEKENYSIIYAIGVTLIRVLPVIMLTYLTVRTF